MTVVVFLLKAERRSAKAVEFKHVDESVTIQEAGASTTLSQNVTPMVSLKGPHVGDKVKRS